MLGSMLPGRALAQTAPRRRFVFAYFDGGWDILLGLDPRDPATTRADVHKIQTGYEQLGGVYQARGVQRRGDLAFGPAVPPELLAHAPDLTIINGIGMDTAAHEVGRRGVQSEDDLAQIVHVPEHRVVLAGTDRRVRPVPAAAVGDGAIPGAEGVELALPAAAIAGGAVDEEQRRALAALDDVELRSAHAHAGHGAPRCRGAHVHPSPTP